jgi:hypothetical protein
MVPKIGRRGAKRGGGSHRLVLLSQLGEKAVNLRYFGCKSVNLTQFDPMGLSRYNSRLFCGPIGRPRSCNYVCRDRHGR